MLSSTYVEFPYFSDMSELVQLGYSAVLHILKKPTLSCASSSRSKSSKCQLHFFTFFLFYSDEDCTDIFELHSVTEDEQDCLNDDLVTNLCC